MKSYESAKEWRLYIKFETNHTCIIWTNTKPLIGKNFLCTIYFLSTSGQSDQNSPQLMPTSNLPVITISYEPGILLNPNKAAAAMPSNAFTSIPSFLKKKNEIVVELFKMNCKSYQYLIFVVYSSRWNDGKFNV